MSIMVALAGWQTRREILEHEGRLYFEVAEQGHCSTCQARIRFVEYVVYEKKLDVEYGHLKDRFPRSGSTLWVGLSKPKPEMTEGEIKLLFIEKLQLPIL